MRRRSQGSSWPLGTTLTNIVENKEMLMDRKKMEKGNGITEENNKEKGVSKYTVRINV